VPFGVLFWKAGTPDWYTGLMQQGRNYRDNGIDFDYAYVNNFVGVPTRAVPEMASDTYSRSLRDFTNVFLPTPTSENGLRADEYLVAGSYRDSVDGRFRLQYQHDGNLVLVRKWDSVPIWATNTMSASPGGVWMQGGDGNLVVYNSAGGLLIPSGWASHTCRFRGAYLVVQSDGNVVLYFGGRPIWQRSGFISGQY